MELLAKPNMWELILDDALHSIKEHGGTPIDADIILGHFGLIGDWVMPLIERIKQGLATILDVEFIKDKLTNCKWSAR